MIVKKTYFTPVMAASTNDPAEGAQVQHLKDMRRKTHSASAQVLISALSK